ncbi:hypothetical protein EDD37DRAFT_604633 [Exophiala viscosa]|uniref:Uncharacterized protein n=1 Tax=Exophiala viscosa TaxID=2486360 RepID=A0AAN6IG03_9EURO|nr:hypothetical protein EDD36DRAFT_143082 [Exophiala viscosa]KAI1629757.1 hypothetical protein EDD37DRAFT_604633 [Exophiala viscosa]
MSSHTDVFEDTMADTTPTHRDLRSQKHTLNREAKKSAKYYRYRAVDPNWIGQQYYDLHPEVWNTIDGVEHVFWPMRDPLLSRPEDLIVSTWTKRDMWYDRERGIRAVRWRVGRRSRDKHCQAYIQKKLQRDPKTRSRASEFAREGADVESVDTCHSASSNVSISSDDGLDQGWDDDYMVDWDGNRIFCHIKDIGCETATADLDGEVALSFVGDGALELTGDMEEDAGFSIISERDFDVMSLSSHGDEVDFGLIWNEDGELQM